jgi:hypothetical protein
MNVISQLLLVTLFFAVGCVVVGFQVISLSRLYRSRAWFVLAAAFGILAISQVWSFIDFPLALMRAQARGVMPPESLDWRQWRTISGSGVFLILCIVGFDILRRRFYRTFGV